MFSTTNICSEKSFVIVRYLGRNYNESFSVKELAIKLKLVLRTVSESVRELERAGIIEKIIDENTVTYRANMENPILREMKIMMTLLDCRFFLKALEEASSRVILFGSCAWGEDTSESDIDLLIETDDKEKAAQIVDSNEFIEGRKISALIMYPNEFRSLRERDRPFYERIMQGKILHGRYENNKT